MGLQGRRLEEAAAGAVPLLWTGAVRSGGAAGGAKPRMPARARSARAGGKIPSLPGPPGHRRAGEPVARAAPGGRGARDPWGEEGVM